MAFNSLEVSLLRFQKMLPVPAEEIRQTIIEKIVNQIAWDGADHLERLAALIRVQERRVERGLALENESGFLSTQVGDAVEQLAELYGKMRQARIQLGLDEGTLANEMTVRNRLQVDARSVNVSGGTLERALVEHPEWIPTVMPLLEQIEHLEVKSRAELEAVK